MKVEAERIEEAYRNYKDLLTPKEQDVITCYYGITPQVRHSLAELGIKHKVTRERIRQIKVEALVKLKIKKNKK